MKRNARLFSGLVVIGAVAMAGASLSAMAAAGSAKVQAIRAGGASYTVDGATWNTLQAGTVLPQGAAVKTDAAGVVDLDLGANGPGVRVSPDTTLELTTLQVAEGAGEKMATTELGLPQGKIHAVVRKLSPSSKWEVKTPVSTCGIRGSRCVVTGRGEFAISQGSGYVRYMAPGATEPTNFDVLGGYMFDPALNNNRGGVIEILPSINLEIEEAARGLQEFASVGGGTTPSGWAPSPLWSMPGRPGIVPVGSGGAGTPWVIPVVTEPSTPIMAAPGHPYPEGE
ncbi:MAG: FecR domain-containing protein [Verrucomicrobiae bacterium]|nr:FecR domain-containing protein [Verrucomicrobiae bacterium]MCP5522725.1 FecR domain-containing protein [Verrucomicrobiales bacterium]